MRDHFSIDADAIRADAEAMLAENANASEPKEANPPNLFKIQTAHKWITDSIRRPAPKKLFGEFWCESELCILFADTNVGKSILAVQIGDAISRGASIGSLCAEAGPQKVIYLDFELSDRQFGARYSVSEPGSGYYSNPFLFHPNFLRGEIDIETESDYGFADPEAYLNHSLEDLIKAHGAKVLIIDNLTYLRNETERAKDALPLMKFLKSLKAKYALSILALAHTPKRDHSKPIGRNDLQGSKMLINFCDSSFAIGESCKEPGLRYLKQIKARNAEIRYDAENVLLCRITKQENFLHFDIVGYGNERDHLKEMSEGDRQNLKARAKELADEGKSQRDIATELGISLGTVNKYLRS